MQKRILCLTKLGQSGSGGNYKFCVAKSYTLTDVSRKKRCVKKKKQQQQYELHNFADASTFNYGQCFFLRVKDEEENANYSQVMQKCPVAPLKITTMPT